MRKIYSLAMYALCIMAYMPHAQSLNTAAQPDLKSSFTFNTLIGSILNRGIDNGNISATRFVGSGDNFGFNESMARVYNPLKSHIVPSPFSATGYVTQAQQATATSAGGVTFTTMQVSGYDNIVRVNNSQLPSLLSDYGPHAEFEYLWFAGFSVFNQQANNNLGAFQFQGPVGAYQVVFAKPISVYANSPTIKMFGQKWKIVQFNVPGLHPISNGMTTNYGSIVIMNSSGNTLLLAGNQQWPNAPGNHVSLIWSNPNSMIANSLDAIIVTNFDWNNTGVGQNFGLFAPSSGVKHKITLEGESNSGFNNVTIAVNEIANINYQNTGSTAPNTPTVTNITEPGTIMTVQSSYASAFNYNGKPTGQVQYLLSHYKLDEDGINTNPNTINTSVGIFYINPNWINTGNTLTVTVTGYATKKSTAPISQSVTFNYYSQGITLPTNMYNVTSIQLSRPLPASTSSYQYMSVYVTANINSPSGVKYKSLADIQGAEPSIMYSGNNPYYSLLPNSTDVLNFTAANGVAKVPFVLNNTNAPYTSEYFTYKMYENATPSNAAHLTYLGIGLYVNHAGITGAPLYNISKSSDIGAPYTMSYLSTTSKLGSTGLNAGQDFVTERGSKIINISSYMDTIGFAKKIDVLRFKVT
ncbi:MAG: hypothetical protein ACHQX1_00870 [Candidatus Micrarchaeales archaeon]